MKRLFIHTFCLALTFLFAALPAEVQALDPPKVYEASELPLRSSFDVYLFIGSSHMAGYGATIGDDEKIMIPNTLLFNGQKWEAAQPDDYSNTTNPAQGLNRYNNVDPWQLYDHESIYYQWNSPIFNNLSPAFYFSLIMQEKSPGRTIGVISNARNGGTLARWSKNPTEGCRPNEVVHKDNRSCYDLTVEMVNAALAQGGTLKGILWLQGGTDLNSASLSTYVARLHALADDLRTEFGVTAAQAPFIAGEIPYSYNYHTTLPASDFNKLLPSFKDPSRKTDYISAARDLTEQPAYDLSHLSPEKGLPVISDNLHFNAESQKEMGIRYANKMLELQAHSPAITTQPQDSSITAGDNSTFTVVATGAPTPTYQWQSSTDGGRTWSDVAGATSATLTLTNMPITNNGYQYRCVVANSQGTATSKAATLNVSAVAEAPTITTYPISHSITAGNNVTFSVVATGAPTPTYQWQSSMDGGGMWSDVAGATNATLTLTNVPVTNNGYQYRCVVANSQGTATSQAVTLVVTDSTAGNGQGPAPGPLFDVDIQKAYIAFFNRPADAPGMAFWMNHPPGGMQVLLAEFARSEEYLSDYRGLNHVDTLTKVYRHLFGRDPEPEGLNYWSAQMEAGWVTIANVAYEVLGGARNEDFDIIQNKVLAANAFTGTLDTPEKIEAYNNAGPNGLGNEAKNWLAAVNEYAASVQEATAKLAVLLNILVNR